MRQPSILKRFLTLVGFGLFVLVLSGHMGDLAYIGSAEAQQIKAEDQVISLPPQRSTNSMPSSPGSSVRPPQVQKWGEPSVVPTTVLPQPSAPTVWGMIRNGAKGTVSIPNKQAGLLVQSQGQSWRAFRSGDMFRFGGYIIGAVVAVLILFYLLRGRIKMSAGRSGRTLTRFNTLERFTHWLTAVPFVVLGLTGLNLMYGRALVMPIIGKDAFAVLTVAGKWLHNFMAFAFMLGLVLMVVLWIRHNLWDRYDWGWIKAGGGMFSDKVHPPARKFNTGQKVVFWAVILSGASISYSGIALMFPFTFEPFAPTFALLNNFGFNLPTTFEPIQEMQLLQTWHAIVALVIIALIIAHIYIGTLGMEGAIDAMWSGEVDENWAREHHAAWVAEEKGEPAPEPLSGGGGGHTPAGQAAHE